MNAVCISDRPVARSQSGSSLHTCCRSHNGPVVWTVGQEARCVCGSRDMILEGTQRQVVLRGVWKWGTETTGTRPDLVISAILKHTSKYTHVVPLPHQTDPLNPFTEQNQSPPLLFLLSVLYPSPPSLSLSLTTLFVSRCESSLQQFDLVFLDGSVFFSVWCKWKCLAS